MAIAKAGIRNVLPENIELISGPGCPVCVTAQGDIDMAIKIAKIKDVIMTTFGDMMRVPGSVSSFDKIRGSGHDIRVVYSCLDALDIALQNPGKRVIFMGVGFETTTPTIAATILKAKKQRIRNFFVLSNFKLVFPALEAIARSKKIKIDGFICPGHVSVITGSIPYEKIAKRFKIPCVITGFEEKDILRGIKRLVEQIMKHRACVEIEYNRAVQRSGNKVAKKIMDEVFSVKDARWRGLGLIRKSGLKINRKYSLFDAEKQFKIRVSSVKEPRGCICGEVLQGIKYPFDCKLFKKSCNLQNPVGPCMVSSEGTCAAYYKYGQ